MSDRDAVVETVHALIAAMDGRDWPAFAAGFTDPVTIDYSGYRGGSPVDCAPGEWAARVRARFETLLATSHALTNEQVSIAGGRATCRSYVEAMHVGIVDGAEDWCRLGGVYTDDLVRRGAEWLVRARRLDVRWVIGNRALLDLPTAAVRERES